MLTKKQLSNIFYFLANTFAEEAPEQEAATPPAKRPGRPPKAAAAPVQTEGVNPNTRGPIENPGPTASDPELSKPTDPVPPIKGKSIEELQALIQPLIAKRRGPEVKAVINKFKPEGHEGDYLLSLIAQRPETHDAFVAEIETLKM